MQVDFINNYKQVKQQNPNFGMHLIPMGEFKGKDLGELSELINKLKPYNQNICLDTFHMNGEGLRKAKHVQGFTFATGTEETNKIFIEGSEKLTLDDLLAKTNKKGKTAFESILKTAETMGQRIQRREEAAKRDRDNTILILEKRIAKLEKTDKNFN